MIRLFGGRPDLAAIAGLAAPWPPGTPSLRDRIAAAAEAASENESLAIEPDEPADPNQLRYAAGLKDALFGPGDGSPRQVSARSLLAALGRVVRRPNDAALAHLHRLMADERALEVIDDFLARVLAEKLDPEAVSLVARRIAEGSPSLDAVKLAIGLLGVCSSEVDRDLILGLGRYDELTLYCAVAVGNMLAEPEQTLWTLARGARGWGRIQTICRLSNVADPAFRRWLLVEAHQDTFAEEVAYLCAVEGGLVEALRDSAPDDAVLRAAGALLAALINGGADEDIDDYRDGAEACALFVRHANSRPSSDLTLLLNMRTIQDFVADADGDWAEREPRGWTAERRWAVRTGANEFISRETWRAVAQSALEADEDLWTASAAGRVLGLDVWPHHLRRQQQGGASEWYFLMQTDDPARVETVLDLARAQLNVDLVGSGPTEGLGLGPGFQDDQALDFIVQDLRRFPGLGWWAIEVALRGRSIRLRNMAHKALEAWDRADWPAEAEEKLRTALEREPRAEVAERIRALLGQSARP